MLREHPKLGEAAHFLGLMEKDWSSPAFQHNLSAFLSALMSCVEHNKLASNDTRFKEWYQNATQTYLKRQEMIDLREFRRKEVHLKAPGSWQEIFIALPTDKPVHGMSWTVNLSAPATPQELSELPDEIGEQGEVRKRYVWDVPGAPDVLELCRKGYAIVSEMMRDYDRMDFRELACG
jgi:hypothetical protein